MRHLKPMRVIALPTVLLVVLTVVATIGSGLVHAASLVLVSGPSPYAVCSTAGQLGTDYVNAEVEPYVAVNPHLAGNVVGVWQQDRWSNGGAPGLVAGHSFDGGAHWGETTLPFSGCARGAIAGPFTGAPDAPPPDSLVSIAPAVTPYPAGLLADKPPNSRND